MFGFIKKWRQDRIVKESWVSEDQWTQAFSRLPLLGRLTEDEKSRLRRLAILLLHQKSFSGAHDFVVTAEVALVIVLQACLPILNLDLRWYRGWTSIIVYPAGFAPQRTVMDQFGVAHQVKEALSGEAWQRGPVVLSWQATEHAGELDGSNLVIHEFAHKLDMLNGAADGFPPLHRKMHRSAWTAAFEPAFADFQSKTDGGVHTGIDAYAASSPAEFFAVLSEVFFERPQAIQAHYPKIYDNLRQFYRQDPLAGFAGAGFTGAGHGG
ncbi:MAG: zinc-dependent peptidase [Gammaproteobacteria bacterium]|nr:zinc-dependent peptidase [Gammaproteobacteria bacterium]